MVSSVLTYNNSNRSNQTYKLRAPFDDRVTVKQFCFTVVSSVLLFNIWPCVTVTAVISRKPMFSVLFRFTKMMEWICFLWWNLMPNDQFWWLKVLCYPFLGLTELLVLIRWYRASHGCWVEVRKKNRDFQIKSIGEDEIMQQCVRDDSWTRMKKYKNGILHK